MWNIWWLKPFVPEQTFAVYPLVIQSHQGFHVVSTIHPESFQSYLTDVDRVDYYPAAVSITLGFSTEVETLRGLTTDGNT